MDDAEFIDMSNIQLSKALSTSAINSMASQSIPINNMAAGAHAPRTSTTRSGIHQLSVSVPMRESRFISSPVVQHRESEEDLELESRDSSVNSSRQSVFSQQSPPIRHHGPGNIGSSSTIQGSTASIASSAISHPVPPSSSSRYGSPIRSFFGSLAHQMSITSTASDVGGEGGEGGGKRHTPRERRRHKRTTTNSSSRSSLRGSRYVIVTEATSIFPSLASTLSLEKSLPTEVEWTPKKPFGDIQPIEPVSVSVQGLEKQDIYDNPNYIDSITSADSGKSLLRRTTSVPHDYTYNSHNKPPLHCREIFADFIPQDEKSTENLDEITTEKEELREVMQNTDRKQWKKTLEDLLEQPEYTDTAESNCSRTGLLAQFARAIAKGELDVKDLPEGVVDEIEEIDESEFDVKLEKKKYLKNLFILSISFMLVFTAYLSIRNLQSSLNHKSGLGLYSLSSVYATLFFGCMFATLIVGKLRPKRTMCLMMNGFLLYVIANFYPHYYTLIPVSALAGFCLAGLWTAHATYLTNISIRYAELTSEPLMVVLARFNGIFYSTFQCAQILGGIISSMVLMSEPVHHMENPLNLTEISVENALMDNLSLGLGLKDTSMCGAHYCHSNAVNSVSKDIDRNQVYLLLGIFTGLALSGILLLGFGLEKLEGIMTRKASFALTDQFLSVFRFFLDWRALCLFFLMFYSLMQVSFMFGEFTTAFVTCASGVHLVGYTMLCMSACGAISSFLNGKISKYVGQMPLMVGAALIHLSLYIVMLSWQPTGDSSSIPIFFVIAGSWGIADGVFLTQTISIFGTLFSDNKEPAFAALKMCQALGATLLFATSQYLCTWMKIYLLMSILILAMLGYMVLHFRLKRQENKAEKKLAASPIKV